jgi:hypothetical protein
MPCGANRARHAAELQVEAHRRELADTVRKLDGLVEAMAEGFRTSGLQANLSMHWRIGKQRLSTSLPMQSPLHRGSIPDLAELYARQVATLHEALADPATRGTGDHARADRARAGPGDRGSFEVELEGEIAAMVELAQGANIKKAAQNGAALPDAFRSSVKVVAGERSQQYRIPEPARIPVLRP